MRQAKCIFQIYHRLPVELCAVLQTIVVILFRAESISDQIANKYATIENYMGSYELKLNSDNNHLLLIQSDAARRVSPEFHVILNTGAEIIQPSK